ncbi:MAG: glycine cleavage system aminomethyltransferase GcvT [Candidatus Scalinduaceae bacterium]
MIKSNKKTPLHDVHVNLGARIVDFHNFLMPLQYDSIINEHQNVRNNAGIFDISHMGEIIVDGKGATELIQKIMANDVSNLPTNKATYTPICNNDGGIIDDIIVYKYNAEKYMLVVNCANIKKDNDWITKLKTNDTNINNLSDQISLLAIQGPNSEHIIEQVFGEECVSLRRFQFTETTKNEMKLTISRTGYTGEDGFEIFLDQLHCEHLWNMLLEKGKDMELKPAGLGARDTLRLEAGFLLYGNDIDESVTPLEANIGWTVKFNKVNFIGKDSLLKQREHGLKKKLIAFKMLDKAIPRLNNEISYHDDIIGRVTSGTFSPTLGIGIGLGYVPVAFAELDRHIDIKIRSTSHPAVIVNTPFIHKPKKGR